LQTAPPQLDDVCRAPAVALPRQLHKDERPPRTRRAGLAHPSATLEEVQIVTDRDSDGSTCQVDVRYAYETGGRGCTGTNLTFGYIGSGSRKLHDALLVPG